MSLYSLGYKPYCGITQAPICKAWNKTLVLLRSQAGNIFYGKDQGQVFQKTLKGKYSSLCLLPHEVIYPRPRNTTAVIQSSHTHYNHHLRDCLFLVSIPM